MSGCNGRVALKILTHDMAMHQVAVPEQVPPEPVAEQQSTSAEQVSDDPAFRERFLREARFAASLDHPNIVPVYETGELDRLLYIAMRLVRGGNLASRIRRAGALPPEQVLEILFPIADALDAAHAADLVHRDVKPANVLLMGSPDEPITREQVYLSDFGLTRHASSLTRLTATGNLLGTLAYIAPEQIRGERLDGRADLYALGCVAFECLTGTAPFVREDPGSLLFAHLGVEPPPVSVGRPQLRGADPVIARALAKRPGERYRTCRQFAAALADGLHNNGRHVTATETTAVAMPAAGTRVVSASGTRGVTVVLVDDHEVVRRGVADLLEQDAGLTVIGQASTVAEALERVPALRPDVAVLDMRLPDGNGVELCRELRSRLPELNCLMLTSYTNEEAMMDAILAGASGYVIKDINGTDLVAAVRSVASGESLLDPRATAALMNRVRAAARPDGPLSGLSQRQCTVLDLIGEGLTNRQIGERLTLTDKVVKKLVAGLLIELGLQRRTQAAVLAATLREHGRSPGRSGHRLER